MTSLSAHSVGIAAIAGVLAGIHAAIWGMYKDALYEGFATDRFLRSVILGALSGVGVQALLRLPLPDLGSFVVLFGLAYATERGIVEVWKTFLRDEDQSKYTIPTRLTLRGVPVRSRLARFLAGVGYVAVIALCLLVVWRLEPGGSALDSAARIAVVGFAAGAIIAVGGAWRDAPMEGFDSIKFLRSPMIALTVAFALSLFTDSYFQIAVATIGYERAVAETYKTFCLPSHTCGKFAGKPVRFPDVLRRRRQFVPVFAAIWVLVASAAVLALGDASEPRPTLVPRWTEPETHGALPPWRATLENAEDSEAVQPGEWPSHRARNASTVQRTRSMSLVASPTKPCPTPRSSSTDAGVPTSRSAAAMRRAWLTGTSSSSVPCTSRNGGSPALT